MPGGDRAGAGLDGISTGGALGAAEHRSGTRPTVGGGRGLVGHGRAGTLGFAGNAANGRSTAAGMARLDGAFGNGPRQPMVPGSWDADGDKP